MHALSLSPSSLSYASAAAAASTYQHPRHHTARRNINYIKKKLKKTLHIPTSTSSYSEESLSKSCRPATYTHY
jgi:hypothetical protein